MRPLLTEAPHVCVHDRSPVLSSEAVPQDGPGFGDQLRELRRRLSFKQVSLSSMIGCSDAAISFWETGARLPKAPRLRLLLQQLAAQGVPTFELLSLRQRWHYECTLRTLRRTNHGRSPNVDGP
jgi:DNA-binding XRE family transcriptional regulator